MSVRLPDNIYVSLVFIPGLVLCDKCYRSLGIHQASLDKSAAFLRRGDLLPFPSRDLCFLFWRVVGSNDTFHLLTIVREHRRWRAASIYKSCPLLPIVHCNVLSGFFFWSNFYMELYYTPFTLKIFPGHDVTEINRTTPGKSQFLWISEIRHVSVEHDFRIFNSRRFIPETKLAIVDSRRRISTKTPFLNFYVNVVQSRNITQISERTGFEKRFTLQTSIGLM